MIKLTDLFRYYKHGTPHQMAAVAELEDALLAEVPHLLDRSQPWYKTWQAAGKQTDLSAAIELIKEFEGCHLSAYPDPLSGGYPWTIGYGTTRYSGGVPVKRGDQINMVEAEMLLRLEIDFIADKLRKTVPRWDEMPGKRQCALVSFAYNLGADFCGLAGFETISRCLRERDWAAVPAALELYCNPGTPVEAGLQRRRRAEARLWIGEQQQEPARLSPSSAFSARITPHIRIGEFALDQEKRRFDYQYQIDIAAELAAFLERARTAFGSKPVIITSGYRPTAINRMVGGASSSEHLFKEGEGAVDWYVKGVDIYKLQDWCIKHWPYSTGKGAPHGFIHIGIRQGRPKVVWDY